MLNRIGKLARENLHMMDTTISKLRESWWQMMQKISSSEKDLASHNQLCGQKIQELLVYNTTLEEVFGQSTLLFQLQLLLQHLHQQAIGILSNPWTIGILFNLPTTGIQSNLPTHGHQYNLWIKSNHLWMTKWIDPHGWIKNSHKSQCKPQIKCGIINHRFQSHLNPWWDLAATVDKSLSLMVHVSLVKSIRDHNMDQDHLCKSVFPINVWMDKSSTLMELVNIVQEDGQCPAAESIVSTQKTWSKI